MGTPRLGEEASLCALPEDVHLQILDLLPPAQIAVFAELCSATRATASGSSVWASVARRHLAVVPPSPASSDSVADLARALLCRWWISTGLFVPGVAVHRRSGFLAVRSRGGVEMPLGADASDTAYVFSGRNAHRCTPTSAPAVEFDFALDPAGPFPVDGLTIRLQHAAELADTSGARGAPTAFDDHVAMMEDLSLSPAAASASSASTPSSTPRQTALVRVELNNVLLAETAVQPSRKFDTLELHVPASVLACKPAVNMLTVRYDRYSTTGYWLRDVTVCPAVLPLPRVTDAVVPAADEGTVGRRRLLPITTTPYAPSSAASSSSSASASPTHSPPPGGRASPRDAPSSPRRARRRDADAAGSSPRGVHGLAGSVETDRGLGRAGKGKTPGAKARTPKHKYHQHQHHQRSPRSPRTRGPR